MLRANDIPIKYATREKNPTNEDNMIYYSEDYPAEYVITVDGENTISLAAQIPGPDAANPTGAVIVQVELEVKPLRAQQWSWNGVSRVLTLGAPVVSPTDPAYVETYLGQLVTVIWKIKKTTL